MSAEDISTRKSRLSETKRLLLEQLLQEQAADAEAQTIPRRSRRDCAPLSFAQRRLWFISQLHPAGCAYNIPSALRLKGRLDVPALELALNEIIRRHESLRTTFAVVNGDVTQKIAPPSRLSLPVEDLSGIPAAERDEKARYRVREEARRPFDLSQGPPLRVNLLRLSRDEHIVLVTMHHIISDGWSGDVFERELATLYEAYVNQRPSPLDELKIQYGDYASWQHEWLRGERLAAELSYWRGQLGGAPRVLELPVTRPRPAVQTLAGRTESFELQAEVSRSIRQLCRQEGATLFMMLLAAFKVLLYRYTGQRELIVGTPIAGRNRKELEGLIGFFVNTLALRTRLTDGMTFRELLKQVRETTLDAYAHQDLPFEKVVEEIHPERNLSHAPLVQVMFGLGLGAERQGRAQVAGLTRSKIEVEGVTAKFDLTLEMSDRGERIGGSFEYSTDLFEQATIRRMATHFQTLLGSVASNPSERISHLQFLTDAERRQLLKEWSETGTPSSEAHRFQQLFEKQAARTPQARALEFAGEGMSYDELNRRANQLARYLRESGVRPDTLVAIFLEKSAEMLVALIAVLKAGGAYVPLDPSYPRERLAFMLKDAKAKLLLTQSRLTGLLPETGATVICLDLCREVVKHESEENPEPVADDDNLAYVIYTSGTTGEPKGVMVSHRGWSNLVAAQFETFGIQAEHRILQFASLGFDASIFETTLALCAGATLYVSEREALLGPGLVQLLRDRAITTATLPPSVLVVLPPEQLTELRTLIVAGEACPSALVARWAGGGRRFFNAYGPTEATVWASVAECSEGRRNPPIGRPIPGAQIYLLDQSTQPVPVGVPGELFIGGAGLARGYLGRPDLTADKFIPHPFADQPGARLYRTGDLGRYLPDGQIEFLGRLDRQVKIRGFRIELGEVEAVMRQHTALQDMFLAAREDTQGRRRLVAYVVPKPGAVCQVTELRGFLADRLPGHMIPSAFVLLEALPLNAHGKVDERRLPPPEPFKTEGGEHTAPRTAAEKILSRIWVEVLNVQRVSVHDNFFALGGDSILSMQLITQARRAGLHLTPRQLFQYQTIAELASVATPRQPVSAQQGLVTGAAPLTPIQHWFFEQNLSDRHHFNLAVMLEARQALDANALATAAARLLEHHDALRLRFECVEGEWRQFNSVREEENVLTRLDLSELTEEARAAAIEAAANELQRSLDLSKGPLVRMALFELGAGRANRLLWLIHHLVVDWVSWRILLEDLATAYVQLANGEEVRLPPKTTSFKEWAHGLALYAGTEEIASEAGYWLAQARQPSKALPVDQRAGDNTVASARAVSVSLSEEETRALLQDVSRAHDAQANEVLLAALARAYLRWTAESRVLVDVDGHGREDVVEGVDLSRTVGWFSALFPVLLEREPGGDMETVLRSVKVKLRGIPNRGIGYGLLRYVSRRAEFSPAWEATPRAEICFTYLGQFDQALNSASLFALAGESPGPFRSERGLRSHLLDVVGSVVGGRLLVNWIYSENLHSRATIELLAHAFIENLIILSHSSPAAQRRKD
jgi:amino acid adenylation domain-containing protein/non-ribosomal peptide synthase protein (TIGR01720 family)